MSHPHMPPDTRLNLSPQFVLGVFLILFGALLTLDRMQVLDAANSLRYWPLVLIALGTWIVIERGGTGRSLPGYGMIVIGALLFLDALGFVRVRFWELFWPMIIVLVGARLIMHTTGPKRERHRLRSSVDGEAALWPASTSGDGTINMFALLGSDKRASGAKIFSGAEVTSILSGTHLDLRQAVIEPGHEAVINIFIMLGGHEVWIPQGWTVVIEVMPILGGVEDKRLPAVLSPAGGPTTAAAPRLVLRGLVLHGRRSKSRTDAPDSRRSAPARAVSARVAARRPAAGGRSRSDAAWTTSAAFLLPLCLVYAFIGLSTWYLCRAFPHRRPIDMVDAHRRPIHRGRVSPARSGRPLDMSGRARSTR